MFRTRFVMIVSFIAVISLLLTACGPTAEPTQLPVSEPTAVPTTAPQAADTEAPQPTEEPQAQPTEEPPPSGQGTVYRIAVLSDMTSRNVWALFDPDSSHWNYTVQAGYWPGLFTYSYQRNDYVPSLAADYATPLEEEGDFWVSTVQMRQGQLWSDGTPLTANDVAWTVNTALAFDLSGNWETYDGNYLDHAQALDDYTVKFFYHTRPGLSRHEFGTLFGPILNAAFWEPRIAGARAILDEIADMDPASEEYATRLGEAQQILYTLDPEGEPTAGPWRFSRWEVGAFSESLADPNYLFRGAVIEEYANGAYHESLEGVYDFTAYGEPSGDITLSLVEGPHFEAVLHTLYSQDAAILALQNGDVDFAENPNGWGTGLQAQLGGDPNITTVVNASQNLRYMAFNFTRPPLDDPALRQAINCMIDKEFLTQALMQGQAVAMSTIVPEGNVFWHNTAVTTFCEGMSAEERLNWAVEHLRAAGYTWEVEPSWNPDRGGSVDWGEGLIMPNGELAPEMTLLAPSPGYDPLRATAGVYIEQWMNQLGMPVRAELTNFNNILTAAFDTGDFDMFILGWGLTLYPDYVCDFFYTGAGFNMTGYSNPDFDALCDQFYAESDLETARQQNFQLQDYLANDLPYIFLFSPVTVDVYRSSTIQFPFTDVLGGLSNAYGFQNIVTPAQ